MASVGDLLGEGDRVHGVDAQLFDHRLYGRGEALLAGHGADDRPGGLEQLDDIEVGQDHGGATLGADLLGGGGETRTRRKGRRAVGLCVQDGLGGRLAEGYEQEAVHDCEANGQYPVEALEGDILDRVVDGLDEAGGVLEQSHYLFERGVGGLAGWDDYSQLRQRAHHARLDAHQGDDGPLGPDQLAEFDQRFGHLGGMLVGADLFVDGAAHGHTGSFEHSLELGVGHQLAECRGDRASLDNVVAGPLEVDEGVGWDV